MAEGHSQALGFFTVDAHKVLRVIGGEAGEQARYIFASVPLSHELVRCFRNGLQRVASKVLQLKLESAELPQALHCRRIERDHQRARYGRKSPAQSLNDGGRGMSVLLAFFEGAQFRVKHGLIRC